MINQFLFKHETALTNGSSVMIISVLTGIMILDEKQDEGHYPIYRLGYSNWDLMSLSCVNLVYSHDHGSVSHLTMMRRILMLVFHDRTF